VTRRLIALDIDGTIAHEDSSISPSVIEQIARLHAAGEEVVIATGRSVRHTLPIVEALGIRPEWVVCANGAITLRRDRGEVTGYRHEFVVTFDCTPVLQKIRPHLLTARYAVEDEAGTLWYTEPFTDEGFWMTGREVTFDQLLGKQATRVVVMSPGHDLEDFLAVVETMGLNRVSYSVGWTAWLDIAPDGVNKSTALEKVRQIVGIAASQLVAVGDGRNDVEMFEWAGRRGVAAAMGQAPPEVATAATRTIGPVAEDGLALFLAEL